MNVMLLHSDNRHVFGFRVVIRRITNVIMMLSWQIIIIFVSFSLPPWRWPHEWAKHVGGHSSSSVICQTTGPKPLPKRFLHIVRSRASSFNWQYPLLSLRSSSNFLRLLSRLLVTSICPFIFFSITCSSRQFLRKMWPIHLNCIEDIVNKNPEVKACVSLCTAAEWRLYICMYTSTVVEGICCLNRLQLHVIYWPL